jgi:Zn finger protein HypA/HybF involved in hydrogenase expression
MGQTITFRCTACDYGANVSGGDDAGMAAETTTVECEHCKVLMDVVIGRREQGFVPIEPRCVNRKDHRVRRWTSPGPCPRCGATMEEDSGDEVIQWD